MKFEAEVEDLRSALSHVARVVPSRATIPILSCVHVSAEQDMVEVRGTDLACAAWARLPAVVVENGAFAISLEALQKPLHRSGCAEISVERSGGATLRLGESSFSYTVLPPGDFPPDTRQNIETEDIDPETWAKALSFAASASAKKDAREYLNGVLLRTTPDATYVEATDSQRFHQSRLVAHSKLPGRALLPGEAASIAVTFLGSGADGYTIGINDRTWSIATRTRGYHGQLLDAHQYPDTELLMKREAGQRDAAICDSAIFADAIKPLIGDRDSNGVSLDFDGRNATAAPTAARGAMSGAAVLIDCEVTGNERLCLNVSYLSDAAKGLGESFVIGLSERSALLRQQAASMTLERRALISAMRG